MNGRASSMFHKLDPRRGFVELSPILMLPYGAIRQITGKVRSHEGSVLQSSLRVSDWVAPSTGRWIGSPTFLPRVSVVACPEAVLATGVNRPETTRDHKRRTSIRDSKVIVTKSGVETCGFLL
jgi:hypothetical protein